MNTNWRYFIIAIVTSYQVCDVTQGFGDNGRDNSQCGGQETSCNTATQQCNNLLQVQSSVISLMTSTHEYTKQIAKLNDRFMQLTADFLELQAQVTGLKTDNQKATLDIDELRHQKTTPVDQQKH
ncbi:unnamed protein product, partial [Owenia fusiformis]